jgi:hypothetical protein
MGTIWVLNSWEEGGTHMPLPQITMKTAPKQKTYKLSDGASLHLLVKPSGSKL